mmetsp:Transcript_31213/g.81565  ORF Transcript_31213/g.81565 Transcript_31213/m.81565 type:complete len:244 (+) Transcript_31213:233-964(+)
MNAHELALTQVAWCHTTRSYSALLLPLPLPFGLALCLATTTAAAAEARLLLRCRLWRSSRCSGGSCDPGNCFRPIPFEVVLHALFELSHVVPHAKERDPGHPWGAQPHVLGCIEIHGTLDTDELCIVPHYLLRDRLRVKQRSKVLVRLALPARWFGGARALHELGDDGLVALAVFVPLQEPKACRHSHGAPVQVGVKARLLEGVGELGARQGATTQADIVQPPDVRVHPDRQMHRVLLCCCAG